MKQKIETSTKTITKKKYLIRMLIFLQFMIIVLSSFITQKDFQKNTFDKLIFNKRNVETHLIFYMHTLSK